MAVTFPRLNPVVFKEDRISFFEQYSVPFYQQWNREDYIVFQVAYDKGFTNGEVIAFLVNEAGEQISECVNEVVELPDVYQGIFRTSCKVEPGYYRIKLTSSTEKFVLYSNWFTIGNFENTLLIEYGCKQNKFDCIFCTDEFAYRFYLRVYGGVKTGDITYGADDVFYSSADKTVFLIDSIPFVLRKYTFGDAYGLPVWMADRLNRIMACDAVRIDEVRVVKNDGAKLEAISSDAYPYTGLKIELLHQQKGDSEEYNVETEEMQAGVKIEVLDHQNTFSVWAEKTGRIHVSTFENIFN